MTRMSVKTQREMLEAAIAADFDDLAAHAAYADLLTEQGDPRGEYIQLRLALENDDQSPRLLAEWRERAHRLYQTHHREWLGNLASFLIGRPRTTVEPDVPNIDFTFRRGWLAELHVHDVRDAFTRILADAPEARMLQALTLRNTRLPNNRGPLEPLIESPYLGTLRAFALGDSEALEATADGQLVPALVSRMPLLRVLDVRAEEVPVRDFVRLQLPNLHTLVLDYADESGLEFLSGNRSLAHLERLSISVRFGRQELGREFFFGHPYWLPPDELRAFLTSPYFERLHDLSLRIGSLGDQGCREIARSGILRRLKRLDLRNCGITDEGAEALARSPDLAHLDRLDVVGNRITPMGAARLQESVIRVQWDSTWGDYPLPDEGGDMIV
jgi:uncharacterized protein (TIGR02996 family)